MMRPLNRLNMIKGERERVSSGSSGICTYNLDRISG